MREGQPARDVERRAELVVLAAGLLREGRPGDRRVRAVGLMAEVAVPAGCVRSGPVVVARLLTEPVVRAFCARARRSQRESQSRWLSSLCRPADANARVVEPPAELAG